MRHIAANHKAGGRPALPRHYAITPSPGPSPLNNNKNFYQNFQKNFLADLKHLCARSAREICPGNKNGNKDAFILLRAPLLSAGDYYALAHRALTIAKQWRSQLILHNCPATAVSLRAAGVHVSQSYARRLKRRPLSKRRWFAVSCHSLAEVRKAERLDADFCVLGPVYPTPTHPGCAPLGLRRFAGIASAARIPVYALGGVRPEDAAVLRRNGAHGIAGIRYFWREQPKSRSGYTMS